MDLSRFVDRFRDAVADHRHGLEEALGRLADHPDDEMAMAEAARRLHTLKGEARMMGYEGIARLAHAAEDHLKQADSFDPDLLLEAMDASARLLEEGPEALDEDLEGRLRGEGAQPRESEEPADARPDERFLAQFQEAAAERLREMESCLRRLGEDPLDEAARQSLLREAHTLKGEARMVGQGGMGSLVHALEDRLKALGEGGFAALDASADLLYETLDTLGRMAEEPEAVPDGLERLVAALRERREGEGREGAAREDARAAAAPTPGAKASGPSRSETVRIPVDKLERLAGVTGDLLVRQSAAEVRVADLRRLTQRAKELEKALRRRLMDRAWLEEEANRLRRGLGDLLKREKAALLESGLTLTELRGRIQEVRMLPISTVFDVYPRFVRNLARELGKDVRLELEGGETELDRRILEAIRDPLVHLIRNALDHGIEPSEERAELGKEPKGRLRLSAMAQGDRIAIAIEDDGRGMDPETIRRAAVEKGVLSEEEAAELDDQQSLELIFRAGFSTCDEVTEMSGRGVGMDVVARNVTALGGNLSIRSRPGEGSTVTLAVPLTLALVRVLLVRAAGQIFAFPSLGIEDIVRDEIEEDDAGRRCIRRGEGTFLIHDLAQVLGLSRVETWGAPPTILLRDDHGTLAFAVEELVGEREMVVKGLGPYLDGTGVCSGATLLGDGSIGIVLDPGFLLERARGWESSAAGSLEVSRLPRRSSTHGAKILVVDDSIVIRDMMRGILEGAGYDVGVAVDGRDALSRLRGGPWDLVVSDVQMPNLDGLGLSRAIRSDPSLAALPIVIVTTLDGEEDRRCGQQAGADAYLVKKELQRGQFLATVRDLLARNGSQAVG